MKLRLTSANIQNNLPENTKIEFTNGNKQDNYNSDSDKLTTVLITFSNGYQISISTRNFGGVEIEELQVPAKPQP